MLAEPMTAKSCSAEAVEFVNLWWRIYHERYDPMVFWEVAKLACILRHRGGNISTGYPMIHSKIYLGMKIS